MIQQDFSFLEVEDRVVVFNDIHVPERAWMSNFLNTVKFLQPEQELRRTAQSDWESVV